MKKLIVVGLLLSNFVFGQKEKDTLNVESNLESFTSPPQKKEKPLPLSKKGQMFIFYGWNRGAFSNSDIHFTGNGYDFQLNNVAARDKQTKFGIVYFDPSWFTVTQYNFRLGYFIKDNLAIVLGIDHMKYVMKQNQTVDFSGTISDPKYAGMVHNGQVDLSDTQFLTFEHTDGGASDICCLHFLVEPSRFLKQEVRQSTDL